MKLVLPLPMKPNSKQTYSPSDTTEAISSVRSRIRKLKHEGVQCRNQGNFLESKHLLVEALAKFEQHWELDLLRARVLHELAFTEELSGNWHRATELYNDCLSLEESIGDNIGRGATLYQLAHLKNEQQQPKQAIRLYQQALEIQKAANDVPGQAATLHQLADLTQKHDISAALGYFADLRKIDADSGDRKSQIAALHQMGGLLARQGKVDKALEVYEESLQLNADGDNSDGDNPIGKAATLQQIAALKNQQGHLEQAAEIYQQAIDVLQAVNGAEALKQRATAMHHLGGVTVALGSVDGVIDDEAIDRAIDLYESALVLDDEPYGQAATLTALGRVLGKHKRAFNQSIASLQKALELLKEIGSSETGYVRELIASIRADAKTAADRDGGSETRLVGINPSLPSTPSSLPMS